jgi:predicted SAM-dependent methyltransferase
MNNIHIGCGYIVGKSWKNYDVTPTARFEKIPILSKIIKINQYKFPKEVIYGDITKKTLCAPNEADNIFCSHTLEHMAFEEMKAALSNIYTMLKPGGCFRLIVPSLEAKVKKYIKDNNANKFIEDIGMGERSKPKKIFNKIRYLFGNSRHLWMYDYKSMSKELEDKNFKDISMCKFGDSNIKVFEEVEEKERFINSEDLPEVCIQCTKK